MISYWMAFLIDSIIGDPYWFPHPVKLMGAYIKAVEKALRRITSSSIGLRLGGFFLTFSTVALTYIWVFFILFIIKEINLYLFYLINVLLLWTTLAAKCLKDEATKVYRALKEDHILKARRLLSYIVGRDTESLDESQITKATIETVIENTSDGVIAPLLYMFVGGAPMAMAYKAVNTLDSMVGYKNKKYRDFGYASAKLDDIVNYIPARITGLLLVLASGFLGLNVKESYRIMIRDRKNHSSPNCGYPEAAAAGALGIQLGGANYYFGQVVIKPTIGDDIRRATYEDISTAIKLMYRSSALALLLFTLFHLVIEFVT
ncbi:cobalamin biosynthesis protein [Alkaliphilus serpentinus]|uniref:Cobalamin biosynthesis protein CobD n=1 Tax=Alkaliphilus serpentinus TaxID=1482731 RepID=A0A833HR94_9FIRM|nr:cobalamin biosynthesis protein [Alkaliphilus serpentinus]KAB3532848.1 cobalamin biosynthesis protein [Alkaliphilus serpentinus]